MDPAVLITRLLTLQQMAEEIGHLEARAFVIEAQDCILRMQRENLELRREVLQLRQCPDGLATGIGSPVPRSSSSLPVAC
jgi:hypothetical protein